MYRGLYADVASDDQVAARRREYEALDRVIGRLSVARESGATGACLIDALEMLEELWLVFIRDVADPENALPADLRRNIAAIGRWIFVSSSRLREEGHGNLDALIDVNVAIRDGLKARI
ncbi:MAG: flagellar biosynthesis regulator FlaF [Hyphomicrobiales bacterium]|nr:flagellar biosynthesis regulator FlaF [Rhodoblastus sp.]MCC2111696.1 flagellar biosynthesis regulator FlaF [Hyphomicrobiales bacterium]